MCSVDGRQETVLSHSSFAFRSPAPGPIGGPQNVWHIPAPFTFHAFVLSGTKTHAEKNKFFLPFPFSPSSHCFVEHLPCQVSITELEEIPELRSFRALLLKTKEIDA